MKRLPRVAFAVVFFVASCSEEPQPHPNRASIQPVAGSERSDAGFDHAIRFVDGSRISNVEVSPQPLRPGEPLRVTFDAEGPAGMLDIAVAPPRDASRQVALGGVDAPPVQVPPDPRRVTKTVPTDAGAVELTLATPWHPRTAVITARRHEGDTDIEAVEGPRTHDGRAVLAMVEVERVPTTLVAPRSPSPIVVDGRLDEAVWQTEPLYRLGHSLDGEPVPGVVTDVWVAWSAEALLVAAVIEDRDIRSPYTQQDDPLWKEEVFEVFVFGAAQRRQYLELQLSPRGVTFDARFEQYRKGDQEWDSTWQTAVALDGTVDRGQDRDRGWTAELAVPWSEICQNTEVQCPVGEGTTLRMNLFRFERPKNGPPIGLSLSPTLEPDFHAPENAAIVELGR
jgi:hypothetical protein